MYGVGWVNIKSLFSSFPTLWYGLVAFLKIPFLKSMGQTEIKTYITNLYDGLKTLSDLNIVVQINKALTQAKHMLHQILYNGFLNVNYFLGYRGDGTKHNDYASSVGVWESDPRLPDPRTGEVQRLSQGNAWGGVQAATCLA